MRLARLGAFHQTRLSFLRAMLRFVKASQFRLRCEHWEIGDDGVGFAVYSAANRQNMYSLVCFAHDLDPAQRTDRVIAEAWDATYTLYDGFPTDDEIARLRENTPKQEAGRFRDTDLILSRTNKSARLYDYVVGCLAQGEQPDQDRLDAVGYIMRTTAVYGNGKFGIADRARYADRPGFGGPFRLEMLTVWMIRQFVADLVDFMARVQGGDAAVPLDRNLRRRLGVGNSTGLGLGPFIVNHPNLFSQWIAARENALFAVRDMARATANAWQSFKEWIARAGAEVTQWQVPDERQAEKIAELAKDVDRLSMFVAAMPQDQTYPWDAVYRWAEANLSLEGQELTVSLLIEPHGNQVDEMADWMALSEAEEEQGFAHETRVRDLRALIEGNATWALEPDYDTLAAQARFWYVSANKLEPRLGERAEEPGAELELPLAIGRDLAAAYEDLQAAPGAETLADFVLRHPEHRRSLMRCHLGQAHPFGEIHDNLIGGDMVPLDLLRCKLSFFGATQFDPKSDRWLRINMFRHAPYPDEFADMAEDDWIYPAVES